MARTGKALTTKALDALAARERVYRVSDGEGLLLEVRPTGAKLWLCRLTVAGKRRDAGLGAYPGISLAEARAAAASARRLAKSGVDPIKARHEAEAARRAAAAEERQSQARTFTAVAELCIESLAPGWKNVRTADMWRVSLASHAAKLAPLPIADIAQAQVLEAVDWVWKNRPGLARKVLRRIGTVCRFAAARGWRSNDNPADLKMLRHAGLPALAGSRKQPSLPWARMGAFYKALASVEGMGALALRFVILTALRSGEARGARWNEISFEGDLWTWTVPGERMKSRRSADVQPHRVPLSSAAKGVLCQAYAASVGLEASADNLPRLVALLGDSLIFPGVRRGSMLSDMSVSAVVRRMNEPSIEKGLPPLWRDADGRAVVPHGFRASFRSWVDDACPEEAAAAEAALGHVEPNAVARAYRRSDQFNRRLGLMETWARLVTDEPAQARQSAFSALSRTSSAG